MLFAEPLQEFAHRTALTPLGLFQAAADAANALQKFLIVEKLLICLGTLHDNFSLPVDGEDEGLSGLLQVLNVLAGVALKFTERVNVGEMDCHTMQFT